MKKIKQAFCEHEYIVYPYEDFYLSVGDEYHDRKSKSYRAECPKCQHKIRFIKRWDTVEQE